MKFSSITIALSTILLWWFVIAGAVSAQRVSVRDFGAIGDDQADDTAAFTKALEAGRNVYVPAGIYRIKSITLPEASYLHGDGLASVIRFQHEKVGNFAVDLNSSCRISNLRFTATEPFVDWKSATGESSSAMLRMRAAKNVELDHVQIDDYRRMGILMQGCEDVRIANCTFQKLDKAMDIQNSRRIQVIGNRIQDIAEHGIQFWGNESFTKMNCEDLIFANNYVYRGGSGAIWGTGARRVVMSGNIVDGAKDIGLDLEWCYDCTITGNTTINCWNAGIALFLSCKNVAISGNSIVISDGDHGRRDGIWLTPVARSLFRKDFGHRNISITGNTIVAEGRDRHGIAVGSGDDIVCAANVLRRADILDRTGNVEILGQPGAAEIAGALASDKIKVVPLSQQWQFAPDRKDVGVKERWFAVDLDDSDWKVLRSDLGGVGWEKQGFAGDDGTGYVGHAWYRAALPELPAGDRPKYVYLHFGLADEQAWVFLNGQPLGEHTEASESKSMDALWDEPFSFEASRLWNWEGSNLLAVRIHNAARAGGLKQPVFLVLSDRPLTVTQHLALVKATPPSGHDSLAFRELPQDDSQTVIFQDDFERYDDGEDPSSSLWSYASNGNNQWEGDTTYVADSAIMGAPSRIGSRALFLDRFSYQERWDMEASPIANFPKQTSGIVRAAFAVYPRAGISASMADSTMADSTKGGTSARGPSIRVTPDGTVQYDLGTDQKSASLKVNSSRWHLIELQLDLNRHIAETTVNGQTVATGASEIQGVDQLHLRPTSRGSSLVDSVIVTHQK